MSAITFEAKAGTGLEQLGLTIAREHLDTAAQLAAAEGWSYSHFLGYLLEGELAFRREKTIRLSLQFSNLPYQKKLEDFDFTQQPSIDRRLVDELATGRFLHEGRNLVFLGPPGVGKTHLAIALGIITAQLGFRIYFTSAIDMARRMAKAMTDGKLSREMNNLVRRIHRHTRVRTGMRGCPASAGRSVSSCPDSSSSDVDEEIIVAGSLMFDPISVAAFPVAL